VNKLIEDMMRLQMLLSLPLTEDQREGQATVAVLEEGIHVYERHVEPLESVDNALQKVLQGKATLPMPIPIPRERVEKAMLAALYRERALVISDFSHCAQTVTWH